MEGWLLFLSEAVVGSSESWEEILEEVIGGDGYSGPGLDPR